MLVGDLLWGGVVLLLALLATHTTTKAQDELNGGLLLDVEVGKSEAILKLLASEDQALLSGGDTYFARMIVPGETKSNLPCLGSWP